MYFRGGQRGLHTTSTSTSMWNSLTASIQTSPLQISALSDDSWRHSYTDWASPITEPISVLPACPNITVFDAFTVQANLCRAIRDSHRLLLSYQHIWIIIIIIIIIISSVWNWGSAPQNAAATWRMVLQWLAKACANWTETHPSKFKVTWHKN